MDYILVILSALAVGAFSIQSAYASSLADTLKSMFGFPLPKRYNPLFKYKSWRSIVSSRFWFVVLFPFITVFIIALQVYYQVGKMLSCSYCTSFWLMLAVNVLVLGITFPLSLVLAPLGIVGVVVIEKLMT